MSNEVSVCVIVTWLWSNSKVVLQLMSWVKIKAVSTLQYTRLGWPLHTHTHTHMYTYLVCGLYCLPQWHSTRHRNITIVQTLPLRLHPAMIWFKGMPIIAVGGFHSNWLCGYGVCGLHKGCAHVSTIVSTLCSIVLQSVSLVWHVILDSKKLTCESTMSLQYTHIARLAYYIT